MTEERNVKGFIDAMERFYEKVVKLDKELEPLGSMRYVKLANKHLGEVLRTTIDEMKESIKYIEKAGGRVDR